MLPFWISFLAISASFIIPAFVGLLLVAAAAKFVKPQYLLSFAFVIYLWFFTDTLGGAAFLGENAGFSGGLPQLVLFALVVVGVLLVFVSDSDLFTSGQPSTKSAFAIPLLVAFAVGIHGFGEGAAFGATAATTPGSDLLGTFGGLTAAVAFILHKMLEPMMVGAAYWAYAKDHFDGFVGFGRDTLVLTLVFAIPGLIGAATDYFLAYDTTYAFAFGLGTSTYAAVRLAKPLFAEPSASRASSVKMAIAGLIGFTCIYVAALLHA